VQDPHNWGPVCGSRCDGRACGSRAKDRAAGLNATVRKVASGLAEPFPWSPSPTLRGVCADQEAGVWVIARRGRHKATCSPPSSTVDRLGAGAEGEGLRRLTRETCDQLVRIPDVRQRGKPERFRRQRYLPVRNPRQRNRI